MVPLARRLKASGWAEVRCPTFHYQVGPFTAHAARAAEIIRALSEDHDGAPVDVVTHSMGGLLLRGALVHEVPLRRVVMLAPPNQGAELAAQVRRILPVHTLGWDPLAPLLPGVPMGLPLPGKPIELGILTGGTGTDAGYSSLITGDNDGKVGVEEARLAGATEFRVVPVRHPWIMFAPSVLDLVLCFLLHGRFDPLPALPPTGADLD